MTEPTQASSGTTTAHIHEFVSRFFAMANAHEFDRLTEFVADEVTVNGTSLQRSDLIAQFHSYDKAVPDLTWTIEDVVVEGDRVALRMSDSGMPVAEFFGLAPTGATVVFTETAFWQVENARITSMSFLFDVDTLRLQLA